MGATSLATAAQPVPVPHAAPLRVLLVGNQEEDFFLIREMLERAKGSLAAELEHVNTLEEAKAMLQQQSFGLVLFEHNTGNAEAVRLLAEFLHAGVSLPFILLTENADEKKLQTALARGHGIASPNRIWTGPRWSAPSRARWPCTPCSGSGNPPRPRCGICPAPSSNRPIM